MNIKLSEYAKEKGDQYINVYRDFKKGKIEGAYKTETGAIMVRLPDAAPPIPANSSVASTYRIPDQRFENISLASDTRSNKSASSEIVNRFSNIQNGLVPFSQTNNSNISVRDAIELAVKAYFNYAIIRNVIEIMVEFSLGRIFFRKGNAKSRQFFSALLERVNFYALEDMFFREFYRSGNVFLYEFKKQTRKEDVDNITKIYGESKAGKNDVILPSKFIVLNPLDIQARGSADFVSPKYVKLLNSYELSRLRDAAKLDKKKFPDSPDRDALESLPAETQKQIRENKMSQIYIPLDPDEVTYIGYKRQSYEALAVPFCFPVLDDINFKAGLRKMEYAATLLINQAILLITTGAEPDKGGINQNNIAALQSIFMNSSVGRVLVADYTTKAEFLIPDLSKVLDSKKYDAINEDIYNGLNYILLGGEKFANQAGKIQIFISRLKYGRNLFLSEFLNPLIKRISQDLNFKNYPEAYFEDINDMKDEVEWARIYTRLAEIGFLTPDETFNALENGKIPLKEESIEDQTEFKSLKDKGFYEPIVGGPATQKDLVSMQNEQATQILDKQNKQATKIQTTQLEHDAKQKSKDLAHQAAHPQPVAPQIHINSPKIKNMNGRPPGSKKPKSTNKPRISGASEENYEKIYSGSKLIEAVKSYDKLEKEVIEFLKTKHKLQELTPQQLSEADSISKMIVRNNDPNNWFNSIDKYIEKPIDDNLERIDKIEDMSYELSLEPHLAALLYASQKETKDKENQEVV